MVNISMKKRLKFILIIAFIVLVGILIRIGYIQFFEGSQLKEGAYSQRTIDRKIIPKRGTIYDATGKNVLAVSATVETVTINPTTIPNEKKELVAKGLSDIFQLDYEKVLKKVNKRISMETIVKKIDKDKANELRTWMINNNIETGINIDEDTKRYYPNNEFASQVIGFCGSDNQGLDGIEAKYDKILSGSKGRILKSTDAKGGEIKGEAERYESAIDGKNIVLSIDFTIQSIVEKYLKQACIDNVCTGGGNIVIMNPKTGDILAMATYPNYNLNEPYEINDENLKENWDNISKSEQTRALQQIWRNKAIQDAYEPGSTFKLITASAALEEGITTTDKEGEFNCTGSIEVGGVRIKCWRYYRPHGSESLRQGLMNSCNPVFIGLGQKLGKEKYYDYLNKFGLLEKTGIALPGEASSIFLDEKKVGPVELGTISFGQRFKITPIQLVTAVSSIANGGILYQPRLVKQAIDTKTGDVEEYPVIEKRRVLSDKTAKDVLSMMESVVAQGTGRKAQVVGYSVGGKTGTSEDGVNTGKYVTSFIGVTPISNPQLVILITLYNPTGEGGHQGGGIAAPIASQVLTDVVAYLNIERDNVKEGEEEPQDVNVPDIRGKSIKEAEGLLKKIGLEIQLNTDNEDIDKVNAIICEQLPIPGVSVKQGSKITVSV